MCVCGWCRLDAIFLLCGVFSLLHLLKCNAASFEKRILLQTGKFDLCLQAHLSPYVVVDSAAAAIPEEAEEDVSPDGTVKIVTCDKETITDLQYGSKERKRVGDSSRAPCIRRSQTFSPARGSMDYVCKVCTRNNSVYLAG